MPVGNVFVVLISSTGNFQPASSCLPSSFAVSSAKPCSARGTAGDTLESQRYIPS